MLVLVMVVFSTVGICNGKSSIGNGGISNGGICNYGNSGIGDDSKTSPTVQSKVSIHGTEWFKTISLI